MKAQGTKTQRKKTKARKPEMRSSPQVKRARPCSRTVATSVKTCSVYLRDANSRDDDGGEFGTREGT